VVTNDETRSESREGYDGVLRRECETIVREANKRLELDESLIGYEVGSCINERGRAGR
jgi:hypothetical protein